MIVNAMYIPKERKALIQGFIITGNSGVYTIAVVDPEMDEKLSESVVGDVQKAKLSINAPLNNTRFISCLAYAKQSINDKAWDALRNEAVQRHKLGSLIPNSKFFKDV